MANYPRITPATLANLAPVINDPTDAEAANKLAQVDLQTRQFVNDYLNTKFDSSTEALKVAALADASLAGTVKGSTGNTGTQQAIVQGTVSTPDLRDLAVSSAKLADSAVLTAKIADTQITTQKIVDKAVTAGKIADATITVAQLAAKAVDNTILKSDAATDANRAVTTDHIRDGAVTTAKLASGAITAAVLPPGSVEGQILITQANPYSFAVKSLTGDITLTKDGLVTLVTKNECELVERQNNGVAAGASGAAAVQIRGNATAWVEAWRASVSSFVTIGAGGKFSLPVGKFYFEASAPAYKTGRHILKLAHYNVSNVLQSDTYYGTSEVCPAAGALSNRSFVRGYVTIAATNDYMQLEHYTELAEATDGLGFPSSSGGTYEIYAQVFIQQVG